MTVRWNCEKCGKVVGYVDQNRQVREAIENPDQFCECPEEG
jgi:transcription initiation factor IIE alpha subunit